MGAARVGAKAPTSNPDLHIVSEPKGLVMELHLVRRRSTAGLIACSLCLRVRRGSAWVEAEDLIRELRTYELPTAPRLQPGVCDDCAEAILDRRAEMHEPVAA